MTLNFHLDEEDYLQHQLFSISKNPTAKRNRKKSLILVTVISFITGFLFFQSNNKFLGYYFLAFGIITLIFFPIYQRWLYVKHFRKHVRETFKNRFNSPVNIQFKDESVEMNSKSSDATLKHTDFENITETGNYFFIALKSGGHVILPKARIDQVDLLKTELKKLCNKLKIDFIEELDWKWK